MFFLRLITLCELFRAGKLLLRNMPRAVTRVTTALCPTTAITLTMMVDSSGANHLTQPVRQRADGDSLRGVPPSTPAPRRNVAAQFWGCLLRLL